MKACVSTKKVQGCDDGKLKPETDFYAMKRWTSNVCKKCRNRNKRKKYWQNKQKKEIKVSPESELFNSVNTAWR